MASLRITPGSYRDWSFSYNKSEKPWQINIYNVLLFSHESTILILLIIISPPNPASEYIYIQNKANNNKIEVLSLEGKILITTRIIDNQEKIDIKNLNSGIYLLRLKEPYWYVYSKFIKL